MSPKELTAFRIEPKIMQGLRQVKERDHISLSVQVHLALTSWLVSRGVNTKTAKRRAGTRRKA
jgi:hypothetical protein